MMAPDKKVWTKMVLEYFSDKIDKQTLTKACLHDITQLDFWQFRFKVRKN